MFQARRSCSLLLLICINGLHAQMFTALYGGSGIDGASEMVKTADGGYLMVGTTGSYGPGTSLWFPFAYVLRTDANGDIVSSFALGDIDLEYRSVGLFGLAATDDGGYLAVGTFHEGHPYDGHILLVRIEQSGSFSWAKLLRSPDSLEDSERGADIVSVGNNEYVIVGSRKWGAGTGDDTNCMAVKIDGNGSVIWTTEFGFPSTNTNWQVEEAFDIVPFDDGGYLVACGRQNGTALVAKIDQNGSYVWDRYYEQFENSYAADLMQVPDGILLLSNYSSGIVLMKLNALGDPIWQKHYTSDGNLSATTITSTTTGDLLIGGRNFVIGSPMKGALLHLDENGSLLSSTLYSITDETVRVRSIVPDGPVDVMMEFTNFSGSESDTTGDIGLARLEAESSGFTAACAYEPFDVTSTDLAAWPYVSIMSQLGPFQLETVDLTWLPIPGGEKTVLCSNVNVPEVDHNDLTIHPNPATTGFWINGESAWAGLEITLFDPTGREVLRTATRDGYVPLPELTPGLYHCRIVDRSGTIASRSLMIH